MNTPDLGKKITDYRYVNKLKQHEMARLLNVSQATICKIENGKTVNKQTAQLMEDNMNKLNSLDPAEQFLEKLATQYEEQKYEQKKEDKIKPTHYKMNIKGADIQVIDIITEVTKDMKGTKAFNVGNVLKYVLRAEHKNGIEDYKKAMQYLQWIIEGDTDGAI